jgi:16S rRNA (adenine1518-N6/adenine1519-N6)-dimethyltransferase
VNRLPAPSKELGQHFLVDENILRVIGRLADVGPDDVVLEIGPGQGVLTAFLAERARLVHAVELDRRLEPHLAERFASEKKVRLHFADALSLDPAALEPSPTKLVANLPYNVATPIVVESLERLPSVETWCVMVQREVADRFFAEPGTKAYGAVSVLIQLATERTGRHPISREVFRPRPNVDSALVAFRRRDAPPPLAWRELKQVVEAAFAHRRKRLPNSLELAGLADRDRAAAALAELGRPETTRAEELSPPEFVRLTEALQ